MMPEAPKQQRERLQCYKICHGTDDNLFRSFVSILNLVCIAVTKNDYSSDSVCDKLNILLSPDVFPRSTVLQPGSAFFSGAQLWCCPASVHAGSPALVTAKFSFDRCPIHQKLH